ncbi:tRNA (adenosine(37)-N6)-threonylcarbamoyltransferase complex transferase subunit TsaD [Candidatus Nomurabacteria bacterium]|nr:tRNA (adenosine(37)-N6)-threonylcarbamoyltransferase complex transferase subunit TsaD [Candidatus Nomurabacteria bacterium]
MKILAIETSCDDTGIAILEAKKSGKSHTFKTLANVVQSQDIHTNYGGVFPMMAKREHGKNIVPVFEKALKDAELFQVGKNMLDSKKKKEIQKILSRENDLGEVFLAHIENIKKPKIDKLAVTVGPGLEPALWVGISFAKALSIAWDMDLIPVNHMEGHKLSILIQKDGKIPDLQFPAMSLLVSGGHTEIVLMKEFGKYKIIGQTRDDACGEAFDKVARMLGLPYPGGPEISRLAEKSRSNSSVISNSKFVITLPRPMIYTKDFDFSFSGLKTAVLYLLRDLGKINDAQRQAIAYEFENATVEVLAHKTLKAIEKYKAKTLIIGGGVSANKHLQKTLKTNIKKISPETTVYFPTKNLSTDNALMIAIVGYFQSQKNSQKNPRRLIANGNLTLN